MYNSPPPHATGFKFLFETVWLTQDQRGLVQLLELVNQAKALYW